MSAHNPDCNMNLKVFDADGDKLCREIALKFFCWKERTQGHAKVTGWITAKGEYVGLDLPMWDCVTAEAFSLLCDFHWTLATCDNGYVCKIFTSPEKGEKERGIGVSNVMCHAICLAVLDLSENEKGRKPF